MDSKSGTRIDNSLRYCVLFSNYGDPGHVMFVAYRIKNWDPFIICHIFYEKHKTLPNQPVLHQDVLTFHNDNETT